MLLLIAVLGILFYYPHNKVESGDTKKKKAVDSNTINTLYKDVETTGCTYINNVLGDNNLIPKEFSNYEYLGYSYALSNNQITRVEGTCNDKKYISKLFGYSYSDNGLLEVNVKVGYVKDNTLYNLNDEVIGIYTKEEESSLLDFSASQIYIYEKGESNYQLKNIKNGE